MTQARNRLANDRRLRSLQALPELTAINDDHWGKRGGK
jgi:hypothetical protein